MEAWLVLWNEDDGREKSLFEMRIKATIKAKQETRNNIQERTTEVLSAGKYINILGKFPYNNITTSHPLTLNKQKYKCVWWKSSTWNVSQKKKGSRFWSTKQSSYYYVWYSFMSKVRNLHLSWNWRNDYPKKKKKKTKHSNILGSMQIESFMKFILLSHVLRIINLLIFNSLCYTIPCAKVTLFWEALKQLMITKFEYKSNDWKASASTGLGDCFLFVCKIFM